jgi:hypothetical protein
MEFDGIPCIVLNGFLFPPSIGENWCFLLYLLVHVSLAGSVYYTLGVDCIHLEYGVSSFLFWLRFT